MPPADRVKQLFALPERIHKGDFVLKLTEGISKAEETAASYVVTPALVAAFDSALAEVSKALVSRQSQAAYLHGSFGSGKSHFMALLSLLLDGREPAWRVPALHALRAKHDFVGQKKLLQLHFHMVGQDSTEGAIFARYLEHVTQHHPDAPLPGLFADEQLFADAARMLDELGDDNFFAPMNASGGAGRLKRKGGSGAWTRERFEALRSSSDPREREQLFSALVKTRFTAYARESRSFIDLDAGLAVMARHASDLGYDAIVLFLDELILWLAARASDSSWMHREIQKMVKLVEAQQTERAVPIVSFIARQRALAEMVGADYAGAESKNLQDTLKHWNERFDTITLEDRNLPAIIEQRVLKAKDAGAKEQIDRAFAQLKQSSRKSWDVMLGSLDEDAFRKLYPFSPALVDALVALSSFLQRDRTAIKVLMELLVEHIEDLELGEVVRVGDLFDVLSEGTDAADPIMKGRFDSAKHLYKHQLLPMLRQNNGTAERCQRERSEHPVRIGCSNCPERSCRNDNRVVKTLLIAALVPEVPALKDMTASKLVALNHGSLKVPIAGTEAQLVAQKLKTWSSALGQLHVGGQADPTVSLQLEGADLAAILHQAQEVDSPAARQRQVRDLLFEAMGIQKVADWGTDHVFKGWRETDRPGHVRFANVRKLAPELMKCPEGHDWRVVIDYPFDDPEFGPHDDVEIAERVRDEGTGTWTLVWLPSFFSQTINRLLGELVILDHILETSETVRRYVAHLSVEQQARARQDLDNLRRAKKSRVTRALEQAYGLSTPEEDTLDPARSIDRHYYMLKPGAQITGDAATSLSDALDRLVPKILQARYPRHPELTQKLTKPRVIELIERFGDIVDADDKRIPADKQLAAMMAGTLAALGLVRVTEGTVHLLEDKTLQALDSRRKQKAVESPTVEELRFWLDENHKMGLQDAAEDLVVCCYARAFARTLVLNGKPFTYDGKQRIPDSVMLEKPDLPSAEDWSKALAAVSVIFPQSFPGRALHADNLKRFEETARKFVADKIGDAAQLPALLEQRSGELGVPSESDRSITARACKELLDRLHGQSGKYAAEALAAFTPRTSAKAMQASLTGARDTVGSLKHNLMFGVFAQLRGRSQDLSGAAELLEELAAAWRQDELNRRLSPALTTLAERAQALLSQDAKPVEPAVLRAAVFSDHQQASTAQGAAAVLATMVERAKQELASSDATAHFTITVRIERKD